MTDTYQRNGYTVEIHYDEDCESPRDNEGNFLFLGFPHRHYKIGDAGLDPYTEWFDCPAGCSEDDDTECTVCEGEGAVQARGLDELIGLVKARYRAHLVMPVGMIDHSGVGYYLGGGAHFSDSAGWDSGTCGLILDTPEVLAECMGTDFVPTDEWLREGMEAEIDEYSKWANGECYGYVIKDRNGDEVGSCWGFIGMEYVVEEANSDADRMASQPPVLYDVRLTKHEIEGIRDGCITVTVYDKLAAIDTSEED